MKRSCFAIWLAGCVAVSAQTDAQLNAWLKRFPAADTNKDGTLSKIEAQAYRQTMQGKKRPTTGTPRTFSVDAGWEKNRFPDHAVCYKSPEAIRKIFEASNGGRPGNHQVPKPSDGVLRIVGTGHSFMTPGYKTLPHICKLAGFEQPLNTHTSGGITGSARYKWEQENGIFEHDGKPKPKLLAAMSNGEWDAMMWGPYFQDRPEYYFCWMAFGLKYNPKMNFHLSDAWPQLEQLGEIPKDETSLDAAAFVRLGKEKHAKYKTIIDALNERYPGRAYLMPTSDAMVLAVREYYAGNLPWYEGLNKATSGKVKSLWRDQLGHLGPYVDRLEGYVFYASVYKKSPELIEKKWPFEDYRDKRLGTLKAPGIAQDELFRRIAWEAVVNNPLTGVTDRNGDGLGD